MPIPITCACGKQYAFKDEFAGKRAKCVKCGAIITVPKASDQALETLPRHSASAESPQATTAIAYQCPGYGADLRNVAALVVHQNTGAAFGVKRAAPEGAARSPARWILVSAVGLAIAVFLLGHELTKRDDVSSPVTRGEQLPDGRRLCSIQETFVWWS